MIYREIDPELYTIDGRECNGLQDIEANESVGERVVAACAMYNFAIITDTFSHDALKMLQGHAAACITEHDAAGWTQRYHTLRAYGIHKTQESRTELPAASRELLQGIAHGIYRASGESTPMNTSHSTIDTTFVTRYAPNGKAAAHYDTTSGVTLETTLGGVVQADIQVGLRGIARVLLGKNMTLVMPGETFYSRGRIDQAKHRVRNVTPASEHRGYRLGITVEYGRLSSEESSVRLQSRHSRGTIK